MVSILPRLPWTYRPAPGPLPALGPDMIDEAIEIIGRAGHCHSRRELLKFLEEALPEKIAPGSRSRFARYLARPYLIDDVVDTASVRILGSQLPVSDKRQFALLQLAWAEPILAAFLEDCLPDPGWRRFTVRGLGNWVTRVRNQRDDTSVFRLIGALKRGGYLRPFDHAWLVSPPKPSFPALLVGLLRETEAPGRTTLAAVFGSATARRSLATPDRIYELLQWGTSYDLLRWGGPGESGVWLPVSRDEAAARLAMIVSR